MCTRSCRLSLFFFNFLRSPGPWSFPSSSSETTTKGEAAPRATPLVCMVATDGTVITTVNSIIRRRSSTSPKENCFNYRRRWRRRRWLTTTTTVLPCIPAWRLKSQPGGSNPSLEAQIPPWRLKSQPQGSNPSFTAEIPASRPQLQP